MPAGPGAAIHGVAVDAGSGLQAAIRTARGSAATDSDLVTFKRHVIACLGPLATTVLVDANLGPALLEAYPDGCKPMLAYEADVYHIADTGRITVFPEALSISDYPKLEVELLKFFMYFGPDCAADLNQRKLDILAEVGAACRQHGLRYLAEPLVYHEQIEAGTAAYAQIKPDLVRRATAAFADPRIGADVLKVEVPVDLNFVEGFGTPTMSRAAALEAFRAAAEPAAGKELVYLSAGVSFEFFEASLRLAREAGVDFGGFMCGRAIWSDAVGIFGESGETALQDWLMETGRDRLSRLINALD